MKYRGFGSEISMKTAAVSAAFVFAIGGAALPAFAGSAPSVFTNSVWDITANSATMGGWVDPNGAQAQAWIEYGTSPALGQTLGNQQVPMTGSAVTIQTFVNNLQPGTTYYYRIVAQNSAGISYGSTLQFTTRYVSGQAYQTSYQQSAPVNTQPAYYQPQYPAYYQPTYPNYVYYGQPSYQPTYTYGQPAYYTQAAPAVTQAAPAAPKATAAAPKKTAAVQTVSKLGDLVTLTTLVDKTDVKPGDEILFKAVYKNISSSTVDGLKLTAVLPQSAEFVSASPKETERNEQALTFNIGSLKPKAEGSVTVKAKVVESDEPIVFTALLNAPAGSSVAGTVSSQRSLAGGAENIAAGENASTSASSSRSFLANVAATLGRVPDYVWFIVIVLVLTFLYFAYQYFWGSRDDEFSGDGERITIQTAR